MPSKLFSFKYLFIIISVFVLSKSKMKDPPIKLWDKTLSEYFSTHDISNYINIEPKICLNNESYYLFVMQTILKFPDTKEEVETLGYTGFCLKEYNFTPVEHSLINYNYHHNHQHYLYYLYYFQNYYLLLFLFLIFHILLNYIYHLFFWGI